MSEYCWSISITSITERREGSRTEKIRAKASYVDVIENVDAVIFQIGGEIVRAEFC